MNPRLALSLTSLIFFFQAEDGIRDKLVTGVQTCALPILPEITVRRMRIDQHNIGAALQGYSVNFLRQLTTGAMGCNWIRSEERRVGKECRSRGSPQHKIKRS